MGERKTAIEVRVKPAKIRKGYYELKGIVHTKPRYPGAPVCGGRVFAEKFPGEWDDDRKLPPSWECFCSECLTCDPNGWDTLAECVEESPGFWCS